MGNLTQGMPQLLVTVEKGSDKKDVGKRSKSALNKKRLVYLKVNIVMKIMKR